LKDLLQDKSKYVKNFFDFLHLWKTYF